jgi:chaperonin cofactor prefoldin
MQAKSEYLFKNTFERETDKVSDEVRTQIENLKTSFTNTLNSLSVIITEEFDSIRSELHSSQCCPLAPTIEHLTLLNSSYEREISKLSRRQDAVEEKVKELEVGKRGDGEKEERVKDRNELKSY